MTDSRSKIVSLDALELFVGDCRTRGFNVVHCHGTFDLIHPGHIAYLRAAKRLGDRLVITVTPDKHVNKGAGRPVFREGLRLETLAELECVDKVALNEWPTAIETIGKIKPDFYVKGKEYEDYSADPTGNIALEAEAVEKVGGKILFTEEETFSSSHLINRFFSPLSPATDSFLREFRTRHSAEDVISAIKGMGDLRVLVIGEAILDQYCYCRAVGKSPKETIVATKFLSEEQFAGGALATANHIAGLCGHVTLMTSVGDSQADHAFIRGKLLPGVDWIPFATSDRPTIAKRRFVEPTYMTKMFEVQFLDDSPIPAGLESQVIDRLREQIRLHDITVVNDFGHGFMTAAIREFLCEQAPFLALNTQSNSANHGFNPVTRYARADYVCLDDPELRLAAGIRHGNVESLAADVKKRMSAKVIAVSLGADGVVILNDHKSVDRVPALTKRVIDRTGAGDALFAVTSPCVFRHLPPDVVGFIGNCAGAIAVETVCNRDPVRADRLQPFITSLLK